MKERFVFVIPCFNAEKTIERMLMSVFMQTHDNWLILIRDDMSTDNTINTIQSVCERNDVGYAILRKDEEECEWGGSTQKVIVWENDRKYWEVENVLAMINSEYVKDDDIICRLDGDDFLCDLCALQDINLLYRMHNPDCLWSAHRWADTHQNISGPMPDDADPYKHPWVSSHFKTFRKRLLNNVNDENFRGEDGEYIKRAGDQAIYLPALHNAKKRLYFPKMTYYYTINMSPETFQTDDAKFQAQEAEFLRRRGYV
jgi:glycosyltransferase involved in cell wall biosynthesis